MRWAWVFGLIRQYPATLFPRTILAYSDHTGRPRAKSIEKLGEIGEDMERRAFLRLAGAPLLASVPTMAPAHEGEAGDGGWRTFKLIYDVDLPDRGLPARLWLPLPDSLDPYQQAMGTVWSGTADDGELRVLTADRVPIFYGEWRQGAPRRVRVESHVRTRDRLVDVSPAAVAGGPLPAAVRPFLQPSEHMPRDGIVRQRALEITRGAGTPLEKARAIYEWIVGNTFRDPKVQGCGRGDIKFMLESGDLGGKCADINSLFVGLARAVGVPARDQFGIRVAASSQFKSLGKTGDVSHAQHCRAEFYLNGVGWVPVDPADVRKVVLEEGLSLDDPRVAALGRRLFGYWEMNWVALNHGRDFHLEPPSRMGRLNFLMYPQAEVAGVPRESLDPASFSYRITAEEMRFS